MANVRQPKIRKRDILMIVKSDPWAQATSGQHTFARHMMASFSDRIAVASTTRKGCEIGKWSIRDSSEAKIPFFGLGLSSSTRTREKPLIPERIRTLYLVIKNISKIRMLGIRTIFVQSPEILAGISMYSWRSVCFRYAGINNPLRNSRYRATRCLTRAYDILFNHILSRVGPNIVLISSSPRNARVMARSLKEITPITEAVWFPTRVDTDIFKVEAKEECRAHLGLPKQAAIFTACGRIAYVKGWDLVLAAFKMINKAIPDTYLCFAGDGEDKEQLLDRVRKMGLLDFVYVSGFVSQERMAKYLNAADVCLVGSRAEGWSLAMMEMLATGRNIVSTPVSGSAYMIDIGVNGYICNDRNPSDFAQKAIDALKLPSPNKVSIQKIANFKKSGLRESLINAWSLPQ